MPTKKKTSDNDRLETQAARRIIKQIMQARGCSRRQAWLYLMKQNGSAREAAKLGELPVI